MTNAGFGLVFLVLLPACQLDPEPTPAPTSEPTVLKTHAQVEEFCRSHVADCTAHSECRLEGCTNASNTGHGPCSATPECAAQPMADIPGNGRGDLAALLTGTPACDRLIMAFLACGSLPQPTFNEFLTAARIWRRMANDHSDAVRTNLARSCGTATNRAHDILVTAGCFAPGG